MSNRINIIDTQIQKDIKELSNEDLFYYLYIHTKNEKLKKYNQSSISNYLEKINYSYFYENIFENKSNYTMIIVYLIGLLIPFYFHYPRFYKLGALGFIIGIYSFISIFQFLKKTYGAFFPHITKYFLLLNIVFYLVFFVLLNKLNHISLFFLSSALSYLAINYIYRIRLTIPTESNQYNKLNAKLNKNSDFTPFNPVLEKVCFQIIDRFQLKLPSAHMLYSYLAEFEIGDNSKTNEVTQFVTNLINPIVIIIYLTLLGIFLNKINSGESIPGKLIQLFPLIGLNENSLKYFTCQANYVLPIQFNYSQYLHEFYQENELDDKVYAELVKAMKRMQNEFIKQYNPCFVKLENLDETEIYQHLKDNHVLNQVKIFLKKNNINFQPQTFITQIYSYVFNSDHNYKQQEEAYRLLQNINNTLEVDIDVDKEYQADKGWKLARNELLYNKNIDEKYKPILQKLIDNYISYVQANLKQKKLYGFDFNIMTFNIFTRKVRLFFNKVFQYILRYLSLWFIFGKPISSGWILANYLFINEIGIGKFIQYFNSDNIIWKFITMGFDYKYLKDEYNKLGDIQNNSILMKTGKFVMKILLYIFVAFPFLNWYNNAFFGLSLSPSYYNLITQGIFFLNIIGNIYFWQKYSENKVNSINPIGYNVIFFLFIFFILLIYILIRIFLIK